MRGLALARLHYLSKSRTESSVPAAAAFLAVLPILVFDTIFRNWSAEWGFVEGVIQDRARTAGIVYILHLALLVAACDLFGTPRRSRGGPGAADLTETAPITPFERFFGDALGIFQCIAMVHLCALPMLALAVALSHQPTAIFFWSEALVIAVMILGSAGASWKLRSTGRWVRTRSARSIVVFLIVVLIVLMSTTRWTTFRDALAGSILDPAPGRWNDVRAAVVNAPLLFALLAILYAGYILYFALSSIRAMRRGQETFHAL